MVIYFVLLGAYAVFSYSLTLENLVLSSFQPYWQFQLFLWEHVLGNRSVLTWLFIGLITALFVVYAALITQIQKQQATISAIPTKKKLLLFLLLISPLLVSYNALSTDVFNYIFNARIIFTYQENPRVMAAIDYPQDPWQRFMVNNYHPSPYGYGWLALSVVPYVFGVGKFITTWFSFRLFSLASLLLLIPTVQQLHLVLFKKKPAITTMALLFLNPLVLLEVVSNFHNDLWMMVPALWSFIFVVQAYQSREKRWLRLLASAVLIWFSITTKLASVVLVPIVGGFFLAALVKQVLPRLGDWITKVADALSWRTVVPVIASIGFFFPLLTVGSQRFHPWYWLWVLVWLPLIKYRVLRNILLLFTISSLFRYVPWLQTGSYAPEILLRQQFVTFLVPSIYILGVGVYTMFKKLSALGVAK